MKLYIGTKELLVNLNNKAYQIQLNTIAEPVRLFSADKCILKDKNGTYLLPKEVTN